MSLKNEVFFIRSLQTMFVFYGLRQLAIITTADSAWHAILLRCPSEGFKHRTNDWTERVVTDSTITRVGHPGFTMQPVFIQLLGGLPILSTMQASVQISSLRSFILLLSALFTPAILLSKLFSHNCSMRC